jgi:hypothetical protein
MNVSEIFCPVCKRKNKREAVVCRHCGASLENLFMDSGPQTKTTDMPALDPERLRAWSIDPAMVPDEGIAVYVEGAGSPVYLDSRAEFVLGRKVGMTSEPLLDLAPSGGYHLGLSRRHAVIRRAGQGYELMDLGSVNGTWLNDQRLVPHQPYPLASGSHLRLGRMRLVVLYRIFA